jgi:hypothetical protein
VLERHGLSDSAAARQPDEVRALDLERIEDPDRVRDQLGTAVAGRTRWIAG